MAPMDGINWALVSGANGRHTLVIKERPPTGGPPDRQQAATNGDSRDGLTITD